MAGGRAFTFRYAETEELLRAAGCDVVEFDPLTDAALPADTAGIYLGGGFPEVHATELAGNRCLTAEIGTAIAAGVPTVAECAGLLYLCRSLDGTPMVGAVPVNAAMTPRLTLGYRTATSRTDSLLAEAGRQVTGHEFHRTATTSAEDHPAWQLPAGPDGFATPTLHAAYLHTHWAGHPALAQRFANAVHGGVANSPTV
jgi:cobyrinic acid a,c-diamide synthase